MRIAMPLALALVLAGTAGCEGPKKFTTTVELVDIERFGRAADQAPVVVLEMRYADCPGDNRRVLRGDKALAQCAKDFKEGDKLKADVVQTWSSDRGFYRTEITKLGDCAVKEDKKDDANYEMSSVCTDVKATGAVVGVHCDRSRPKELVEKCAFLRRR